MLFRSQLSLDEEGFRLIHCPTATKSFSDEDEIRRYCEGRIAHFKIPRYVKFVDEFPLTVTGKVQKFVMREAMAQELGLARARHA